MSPQASPKPAWSVPVGVADIPETGRHIDIAADATIREALARTAGLVELPRLEAGFDLTRHSADGVRVAGRVTATVVQSCVVTLEPIESRIDEIVDLLFLGDAAAARDADDLEALETEDPPETLREGGIDLGLLAAEFLLLGIDPYPRKPGAVFAAPPAEDHPSGHPFAALAALKKDNGPKGS